MAGIVGAAHIANTRENICTDFYRIVMAV